MGAKSRKLAVDPVSDLGRKLEEFGLEWRDWVVAGGFALAVEL